MTYFKRKAAFRIGFVSITLAVISSVLAWYISKESFEESIVSLAYEDTQRLVSHHNATTEKRVDIKSAMEQAAKNLTGGLFDIAEIYDTLGSKLAESLTGEGARIEDQIPHHPFLNFNEPKYESFHTEDGHWVLRVFVPLQTVSGSNSDPHLGYFEGVRIVPEWQQDQIFMNSLVVSLLVSIAALSCGLVVYPLVVMLSKDNERKALEVLDSHISMMEALGRAIAKRDSDTGAHNYRVAWIASRIGEKAGLSGSKMQSLIAGSFLHDVGKIGISDSILLKPGKLTDDEFDVMRTHVQQGEEIVNGMGWLDGANEVVSAHHEKWNGTGYPRKLKEGEIPLSARIFAIADVFDALSSKRPYKAPMPYQDVMEILKKDTGSHFDPAIMKLFLPISEEVSMTLENSSEDETRQLLEERVRKHFYI